MNDMVNELMEQFKEQSVVNFISLLGESQYTARCLLSHSKYFLIPKGLCSFEHSKVCFQPLQMNWAASNLMFARTWQGMFRVTQNLSGYSRKPRRITRISSSEVGIISKLENFLGYYSFIPDKINTFVLNSID